MNRFNIPCVIFAGGKSSRMGKDKALLPFKNSTLIRYQYERLVPLFSEVAISTKSDKFDFRAPLILDSSDIFAPTPAFLDIIAQFNEFFALAVDTPFVDEEVIARLYDAAAKHPTKDAIVAKTDYPHPLVAIYRKSILPHLQRALEEGNYKLNAIIRQADTLFVEFDEEEKFFNINYPEDFTKAKNML